MCMHYCERPNCGVWCVWCKRNCVYWRSINRNKNGFIYWWLGSIINVPFCQSLMEDFRGESTTLVNYMDSTETQVNFDNGLLKKLNCNASRYIGTLWHNYSHLSTVAYTNRYVHSTDLNENLYVYWCCAERKRHTYTVCMAISFGKPLQTNITIASNAIIRSLWDIHFALVSVAMSQKCSSLFFLFFFFYHSNTRVFYGKATVWFSAVVSLSWFVCLLFFLVHIAIHSSQAN